MKIWNILKYKNRDSILNFALTISLHAERQNTHFIDKRIWTHIQVSISKQKQKCSKQMFYANVLQQHGERI